MPGGDATGPAGMGPGTGWGMGPYGGYGYGVGIYASRFGAYGFGPPAFRPRFGGGGRGYRNMFWATGLPGWFRGGDAPAWGRGLFYGTPEQERQVLEAQMEQMRATLSSIEARLMDLDATAGEESQKRA